MSTEGFYSYENNIEVKSRFGPKECEVIIEQYLDFQNKFAPPESLKKLDEYMSGMLKQLSLFKESKIVLFQNLVDLSKTNLFTGPIRIVLHLKNSSAFAVVGALHYMKGNIEIESKMKLKMLAGKKPTPKYKGTGTIYLEPVPWNTQFITVPVNGVCHVDKGLFYACQGSIKKKTVLIKSLSAKVFGGEGLLEHQLTGKGWCLIKTIVKPSQIHKIKLNNETLRVDGNFVMLRLGEISFTVEAIGSGIHKVLNTSGEGFVNVYKGTGEVWLCPNHRV